MDYAKINQEAVKAGIKGTRWENKLPGAWAVFNDEKYLMITFDGYCAYFLPENMIKFQVKGLINTSLKDPFHGKVFTPENEIQPTKYYIKENWKKAFIRIFKGEKEGRQYKTYIDERFLKPLEKDEGVRFYQENDDDKMLGIRPIFAFDMKDKPLMMILPVRMEEGDPDC